MCGIVGVTKTKEVTLCEKQNLSNHGSQQKKQKERWLYCRGLSAVWSPFLYERRKRMEKRIFKQLVPGVDEKYVERAFEKLKKNGCPEGEDLLTWFGKLVSAEIVSDALRIDDNEGNN